VRGLADLGENVEPALRQAATRATSLELRRRIEQLLARLPSAKDMQMLRAIEVLEHIGSSDGRQLLRRLAAGIPEARLTQEARASLARLAK
jgi:hypothetical protein